jgi:hypothetical protein
MTTAKINPIVLTNPIILKIKYRGAAPLQEND